MDDATRICTKCDRQLPLTQFDKVKSAKLGRRSDCKSCRSAAMKAWYAANRERQAARERDRKAARPDVYRERDRKRDRDPHRVERHAERVALRRARISDVRADPGVTRANLRKQYGDECFYCGVQMTFVRRTKGDPWPLNLATLDHVFPVSRGGTHTWDNAVLACWECNCSKHTSSLAEWSPKGK